MARKKKISAKDIQSKDTCLLWISYTESFLSVPIAVDCSITAGEFKQLVVAEFLQKKRDLFTSKVSSFDVDIYPKELNSSETLRNITVRNNGQVPNVVLWPLPEGSSPISDELMAHRQSLLLKLEDKDFSKGKEKELRLDEQLQSVKLQPSSSVDISTLVAKIDGVISSNEDFKIELRKKNAELARKNAELDNKDAELARKNAELARKNAELDEKNEYLKLKMEENAAMNSGIYLSRFADAYIKECGLFDHLARNLNETNITVGKVLSAMEGSNIYQNIASDYLASKKSRLSVVDLLRLIPFRQARSGFIHTSNITRNQVLPYIKVVEEEYRDVFQRMYDEYFRSSS
jgi:hypothetical protein